MMNSNCSNIVCGKSGDGDKVPVRMHFSRKELLYDIENYAYIEGHVMGEEKQHAQHTLVDIGQDGNVDRVSRILSVVHAAAVEMLYPYTREEPVEEDVDDRLEEPEEYLIELSVPKERYSRTTVRLLSRLIHEFMVYSVLHDWMTTTSPDAAAAWQAKAENAKAEIEKIKRNGSSSFLRHPTTPFG